MFLVLSSGESSWGGGFSWCCCWLHGDMHHYFCRMVVCRYTPLSLILICIGGGSCPGMFIHSTGEGSCPGMLVIHLGEGLCPGML